MTETSSASSINETYLETFFSKKEFCFYKMIKKFFECCNKNDILKMIDIIEKKSDTSLRVLDWFVTKYSKKRIDELTKNNDGFDVRISYKAQLKAYKKHYFDPFRRRQNSQRFKYFYDKTSDEYLYTTLGQLNFFKWAISNNIIDYVEKNINQINIAMNLSNKADKKRKITKNEKKNNTTSSNSSSISNSSNSSSASTNSKNDILNNLILTFN